MGSWSIGGKDEQQPELDVKIILRALLAFQGATAWLPQYAKVLDIIEKGIWVFHSGSQELQPIWDSVHFHLRIALPDHYFWKGYSSRRFPIDLAWEVLRNIRSINFIHSLLQFLGHILRHSFIIYLAYMGYLNTINRLHAYHIINSSICILYRSHIQTHDHLFFQFPFSVLVQRAIINKTFISWPYMTWQHLFWWVYMHYKQKNEFMHLLAQLVLSATIYFIWYKRINQAFHQAYRLHHVVNGEIFQLIQS